MTIRKKTKKYSHGFTLAELMLVVAIIVILTAFGFAAVIRYQRSLKRMELDNTAREIFVAAQNHLTAASASGEWEYEKNLYKTNQGWFGTEMNSQPDDFPEGSVWDKNYVYLSNEDLTEDSALTTLLPAGSIDGTVRDGGVYVVEYNKETTAIYSVFYAEKQENLAYSAASVQARGESSDARSYRGKAKVGYYGGATAVRSDGKKLKAPILSVRNAESLVLTIVDLNAASWIDGVQNTSGYRSKLEVTFENKNGNKKTFSLGAEDIAEKIQAGSEGAADVAASVWKQRVSQGISEQNVTYQHLTYQKPYVYTIVLDSITRANGHFADLFTEADGFKPGEDLTVTAAIVADGAGDAKSSVTVNSLFEKVENKDGTNTALVSNARHLENLSTEVSGIQDVMIRDVKVTRDIAWKKDTADMSSAVRAFVDEIKNAETRYKYAALDTGKTQVSVYLHNGGNESDKYLKEDQYYGIQNNAIQNVIGNHHTFWGFEITHNIKNYHAGLFASAEKLSVKDLYLADFTVHGKNGAAGALVGQLNSGTIQNVGVQINNAVQYEAGTYDVENNQSNGQKYQVTSESGQAGGLIGAASEVTVKDCYASIPVQSTGVSGIAGGLIGTVSGKYELNGNYVGGFISEDTVQKENDVIVEADYSANTVNVAAPDGIAGGFIAQLKGRSGNAVIEKCYTTASVFGGVTAGGFAAETSDTKYSEAYTTARVFGKNASLLGTFAGTSKGDQVIADETKVSGALHGINSLREGYSFPEKLVGNGELQSLTEFSSVDLTKLAGESGAAAVSYHETLGTEYPYPTVNSTSPLKQTFSHYGDWPVAKEGEAPAPVVLKNEEVLKAEVTVGKKQNEMVVAVIGHSSLKVRQFVLTSKKIDRTGEVSWTIKDANNSRSNVLPEIYWTNENGNTVITLILDDITTNGQRFASLFSSFVPGEDITVAVQAGKTPFDSRKLVPGDKKLENTATANSLFGNDSDNDLEKTGIDTIYDKNRNIDAAIYNFRHLENLEGDISGIDEASTKGLKATQARDLDWNEFKQEVAKEHNRVGNSNSKDADDIMVFVYYQAGSPEKGANVSRGQYYSISNNRLTSYDGNYQTISNFYVDLEGLKKSFLDSLLERFLRFLGLSLDETLGDGGMFGKLNANVRNLTLFNCRVQSEGASNIGILAGSVVGNSSQPRMIENVVVYGEEWDENKSVYQNQASIVYTNGGNAGGLIGKGIRSLTIKNCAAAIPVKGNVSGGLVGFADQITIENSYSGGHTVEGKYVSGDGNVQGQSEAGGLVGYMNGTTIENCYSTASIYSNSSSAYVGGIAADVEGTSKIINTYATGRVGKNTSSLFNNNIGAFVGRVIWGSKLSIENCSYEAEVNDANINDIGSDLVSSRTISKSVPKNQDSAIEAHPYDPSLAGTDYPYQSESTAGHAASDPDEKTHYGDWPETDSFDVGDFGIIYYEKVNGEVYYHGYIHEAPQQTGASGKYHEVKTKASKLNDPTVLDNSVDGLIHKTGVAKTATDENKAKYAASESGYLYIVNKRINGTNSIPQTRNLHFVQYESLQTTLYESILDNTELSKNYSAYYINDESLLDTYYIRDNAFRGFVKVDLSKITGVKGFDTSGIMYYSPLFADSVMVSSEDVEKIQVYSLRSPYQLYLINAMRDSNAFGFSKQHITIEQQLDLDYGIDEEAETDSTIESFRIYGNLPENEKSWNDAPNLNQVYFDFRSQELSEINQDLGITQESASEFESDPENESEENKSTSKGRFTIWNTKDTVVGFLYGNAEWKHLCFRGFEVSNGDMYLFSQVTNNTVLQDIIFKEGKLNVNATDADKRSAIVKEMYSTAKDILVSDCKKAAAHGFADQIDQDATIENITIYNSEFYGNGLARTTESGRISGCKILGSEVNGNGVSDKISEKVIFSNLTISNSQIHGNGVSEVVYADISGITMNQKTVIDKDGIANTVEKELMNCNFDDVTILQNGIASKLQQNGAIDGVNVFNNCRISKNGIVDSIGNGRISGVSLTECTIGENGIVGSASGTAKIYANTLTSCTISGNGFVGSVSGSPEIGSIDTSVRKANTITNGSIGGNGFLGSITSGTIVGNVIDGAAIAGNGFAGTADGELTIANNQVCNAEIDGHGFMTSVNNSKAEIKGNLIMDARIGVKKYSTLQQYKSGYWSPGKDGAYDKIKSEIMNTQNHSNGFIDQIYNGTISENHVTGGYILGNGFAQQIVGGTVEKNELNGVDVLMNGFADTIALSYGQGKVSSNKIAECNIGSDILEQVIYRINLKNSKGEYSYRGYAVALLNDADYSLANGFAKTISSGTVENNTIYGSRILSNGFAETINGGITKNNSLSNVKVYRHGFVDTVSNAKVENCDIVNAQIFRAGFAKQAVNNAEISNCQIYGDPEKYLEYEQKSVRKLYNPNRATEGSKTTYGGYNLVSIGALADTYYMDGGQTNYEGRNKAGFISQIGTAKDRTGYVNNCSVTGSIYGNKCYGFVGINYAKQNNNWEPAKGVQNCYSNVLMHAYDIYNLKGDLNDDSLACGFAGINNGTMTKCHALGTIVTQNDGSGFVMENGEDGIISYSYTAIWSFQGAKGKAVIEVKDDHVTAHYYPYSTKNTYTRKGETVTAEEKGKYEHFLVMNEIQKIDPETKIADSIDKSVMETKMLHDAQVFFVSSDKLSKELDSNYGVKSTQIWTGTEEIPGNSTVAYGQFYATNIGTLYPYPTNSVPQYGDWAPVTEEAGKTSLNLNGGTLNTTDFSEAASVAAGFSTSAEDVLVGLVSDPVAEADAPVLTMNNDGTVNVDLGDQKILDLSVLQPTREGYRFVGWQLSTADTTLSAEAPSYETTVVDDAEHLGELEITAVEGPAADAVAGRDFASVETDADDFSGSEEDLFVSGEDASEVGAAGYEDTFDDPEEAADLATATLSYQYNPTDRLSVSGNIILTAVWTVDETMTTSQSVPQAEPEIEAEDNTVASDTFDEGELVDMTPSTTPSAPVNVDGAQNIPYTNDEESFSDEGFSDGK